MTGNWTIEKVGPTRKQRIEDVAKHLLTSMYPTVSEEAESRVIDRVIVVATIFIDVIDATVEQ